MRRRRAPRRRRRAVPEPGAGRRDCDGRRRRSAEVDPSADAAAAPPELHKSSQCYTCKARFTTLHHYAQLCPGCAALNYRMRHATADLSGRVALLNGARVKIGLQIGLKLLRAGATLVATSRFPADMARRYAEEPDFPEWRHRLQLHAADLRDVHSLERFCDFLLATLPRLDIVINNACQTVRRPASYYAHLLPARPMERAARGARAGRGCRGPRAVCGSTRRGVPTGGRAACHW